MRLIVPQSDVDGAADRGDNGYLERNSELTSVIVSDLPARQREPLIIVCDQPGCMHVPMS